VQEIIDIITFKTMISEQMLFVFYYLGAITVPFIIFLYTKNIYKPIQKNTPKVFMEILWRMMFEFLIAFLQIRDALVL